MYQKLDEFAAMKKSYEEKLAKEGRSIIQEVLKKFFDQCPKIQALRWKQYTPFFNDGDPCTFSVRSINCQVSPEDEADNLKYSDGEGWTEDGHYGLHDSCSLYKPLQELNSRLYRASDLMEAAFGDHVEVTVTRDGNVTTRDYDNHN